MKIIIILASFFPVAAYCQTESERNEITKEEALKEFGQTPEQIKDYFKSIGNTKTNIVIGKKKLYSPLNLEAYMKGVKILEKELGESSDGVEITDKLGRVVIMIPVASMFVALKSETNFPEANAALGYILTDKNKYVGVFVLKLSNNYVAILKDGKTEKIEAREGALGFETAGNFVRIKSLEFDQ